MSSVRACLSVLRRPATGSRRAGVAGAAVLLLRCLDILAVTKASSIVVSRFDVLTTAAAAAVRGDGRPCHDASSAGAGGCGVGYDEEGLEASDQQGGEVGGGYAGSS